MPPNQDRHIVAAGGVQFPCENVAFIFAGNEPMQIGTDRHLQSAQAFWFHRFQGPPVFVEPRQLDLPS